MPPLPSILSTTTSPILHNNLELQPTDLQPLQQQPQIPELTKDQHKQAELTELLNALYLENTSTFNLDNDVTLLTKQQEIVLALGLKFIPHQSASTPKIKESLHTSIDKLHRQLALTTFFHNTTNSTSIIPRLSQPSNFSPIDTTQDNSYKQLYTHIDDFRTKSKIQVNKLSSISYLSPVQRFINSTLLELRNNKDIIIKPADKNLGTCIMKKTTYQKHCIDILDDLSTYRPITFHQSCLLGFTNPILKRKSSNPNTPNINQHPTYIIHGYERLISILNDYDILFQQQHNTVTHNGTGLEENQHFNLSKLATSFLQLSHDKRLQYAAKFYILLKMHKPKISGRPIVNCIDTMSYHVSKWLSATLNQVANRLPSITNSSSDSLRIINSLRLDKLFKYILLSADVKSLYPSIPISYGLKATRRILEDSNTPNIDLIIELLEWVLSNNFLTFDNFTYKQVSGTAMGTPCAPPYANIVLFYMEQNLILAMEPTLYLRYLDDIFAVFPNQDDSLLFVEKFNEIHPAIQLDAVNHSTKDVVFLDQQISINKHGSGLDIKLYQKPSNKYLYLPPSSAHKGHILKNFIRNELIRYRLYNTLPEDFHRCRSEFFIRLRKRGYSPKLLASAFRPPLPSRSSLIHALELKHRNTTHNKEVKNDNNSDPVAILSLPNYQHLSVSLENIFKLPCNITNHEYYNKAFPRASRQVPILANVLGKSILRLIDVDKFTTPHAK